MSIKINTELNTAQLNVSAYKDVSVGDKLTFENCGVDSLGRTVINGLTRDGKKPEGKLTLTVFTVKQEI